MLLFQEKTPEEEEEEDYRMRGEFTLDAIDSVVDWLSLPARFWILSFDCSAVEFLEFLEKNDRRMYDMVRRNYREYLHVRRLVEKTTLLQQKEERRRRQRSSSST